jgi:hypothetical protein
MNGRIRLGCIVCSREDFDGIDMLPKDWEDIDEVQSFDESIQEVDPDDPDGDVTFWETHIGLCPDCQKENVALVASEEESDFGSGCTSL